MSKKQGRMKWDSRQNIDTGKERTGIEERVLDYFRRNSNAMDSLEGISRFWVHERSEAVEQCLSDLHERGFLVRRNISGTHFYSLRDHSEPVAQEPSTLCTGAATPPGDVQARILLVDDEASVRQFMVEALSDVGHSVTAVEDGEQAIDMIQSKAFDLVVSDVVMPGASGIKVLQSVKQHSPTTEVIIITGRVDLDTAIGALRHGAYDLITKPIDDLDSFYRVIARALERKKLSFENRLLVENLQRRNLELKENITRFAAVGEMGKATAGVLDLQAVYGLLVQQAAQHLNVRRVSLLVTTPHSTTMRLVASVGIVERDVSNRKITPREGIAGRVAATQDPLLVPDIEKSEFRDVRSGGKYATPSFMIAPLILSSTLPHERRHLGVINVSDKHTGDRFTDHDLEFLSMLASQMALAIERGRQVKQMEDGYLGALIGLIRGVEDSRPETFEHSKRVASVAGKLARAMGLEEKRIEQLLQAVALHELGRMSGRSPGTADEAVRNHPGDEWGPAAVMAAERLLAPTASIRTVRDIILHSADPFGATPIPSGADRPSIPIEARILGVCEEFVRLSHSAREDHEKKRNALLQLKKKAGTMHDPEVVGALLGIEGSGVEG